VDVECNFVHRADAPEQFDQVAHFDVRRISAQLDGSG
jgi:hypothetical protein